MEEQQNIKKEKTINPLTGLGSSLFYYKWITKNIGFFLFIASLAVVYIANGHKADQMLRDIDATQKNVKELQYEYKTLKSEMIFKTREAEVVEAAQPLGLQLPTEPPMRIKKETTKTK
ncbi:MAG: FtsL-like putative cell division protein [Chitinophagaceae bacterium]